MSLSRRGAKWILTRYNKVPLVQQQTSMELGGGGGKVARLGNFLGFEAAVLSVIIEKLIEKSVSDVLVRFGCQEHILTDLIKWEKILLNIRAVLDDADEKQMTNRMMAQIEINTRLQDIATEKDRLGPVKNSEGRFDKVKQKLPTYSLVNEANVYGREEDKEAIPETLLRDYFTGDGVPVISIAGMGGIGKLLLLSLFTVVSKWKIILISKHGSCL
ncbi:putative disease resistance RPP13-like protein 1 [Mangifera indica]|uniref:putative disease resistance RPP13-like protein 1 n=1 Tax=Mangifera indica TaxID=29780 RepID=UPI001CFAC896|nr:putative disease resistance RPP13-like protein 1 [Mangifera indica]